MNDLDIFYDAYVECACWTEEITEPTKNELHEMLIDCGNFIQKAIHLMEGLDLSQCGHDFWLTRNRHGTGFWDRGYEESIANKLTELSKKAGEYYVYGDDE
jgi:hypothetical protein